RPERRLRRAPRRRRAPLPRGADEDQRRERGTERVRGEAEAGMERPLSKIIARLRDFYGAPRAAITDPYEMILLENVAYLVDDARRLETFRKLRDEIGLTPDAILSASAEKIAKVTEGGGMLPPHRAAKVIACARLAEKIGVALDKKILRKYPGVGEPLADKIL